MQEVFVGYQSALEFWRKAKATEVLPHKRVRIVCLPTKIPDAHRAKQASVQNLSEPLSMPLHILVADGHAHKFSQGLVRHIATGTFANNSFFRMSSDLLMSSPELCFLQMANTLSLLELIVLGFELCGRYRLDAAYATDRGFRDDISLTNVVKLKAYIASMSGAIGHKKAQRALRFVADGSASPMETVLVMLLTLPYRLGGYNFSTPLLNHPIYITESSKSPAIQQKSTTGTPRYYCDLYWPSKKVDVEYDSDTYHASPERLSKDAIRRNTLLSMGVIVLTVSRMQIFNVEKMHVVARSLSKLLGKRLRYSVPEFTLRRAALRKHLLRKEFRT